VKEKGEKNNLVVDYQNMKKKRPLLS